MYKKSIHLLNFYRNYSYFIKSATVASILTVLCHSDISWVQLSSYFFFRTHIHIFWKLWNNTKHIFQKLVKLIFIVKQKILIFLFFAFLALDFCNLMKSLKDTTAESYNTIFQIIKYKSIPVTLTWLSLTTNVRDLGIFYM